MTPDEKSEKREQAIQALMLRAAVSHERAEELIDQITKALFGPNGRFSLGGDEDGAP